MKTVAVKKFTDKVGRFNKCIDGFWIAFVLAVGS